MSMRQDYVPAMCVAMCVLRRIMNGVRNVLRRGAHRGARECVAEPVLGVMTLTNDLLGQMRYEWQHVGHAPPARAAMASLAEGHQHLDLGSLRDLYDVVSLLEARGG